MVRLLTLHDTIRRRIRTDLTNGREEKEGRTYRDVGVTRTSLRVSGGEDGVDKDEGANYLSTQSGAGVVAGSHSVGATTETVVVVFHESLNQTNTADGAQALSHHVGHSPDQRHLTSQEQSESNSRVYVTTWNKNTQDLTPMRIIP